MAPEQFRGQISKESDQYALGCIAYELLTGRQPFSAPDFVAMGFLHTTETPLPPTRLNPQLSRFIDQAILKAMAKQRADRHADIAAFLQSLHPPVPSEAPLPTAIAPLAPTIPVSPAPAPPLIVAQRGGGHYTSINEALRHAKAKARILIRPGTYLEELVLDKPVEIVGDGPREQIILESRDADCILMQTDTAIVQGLTLRCRAGLKNKTYYAVDIPRGQLTLQDCDISSDSLSCVAIHGPTTTPVVRNCTIHDGKAGGVFIYENGQGTIEDCNILGNALAAVEIRTGGNPVLHSNKIHGGKASGVYVHENGQGRIEDCDIFGNALTGVRIRTGGNPVLCKCKIHDGKQGGVYVYEDGQGRIEDCDLFGNTLAGVKTSQGGNLVVRRCTIHDGKASGMLVYENGQGTIEDCDISGNAHAGVQIKTGGNPVVRKCTIHDGKASGVYVNENGQGTIEDCDISGNSLAGVQIKTGGNPQIQGCRIHRNKYEAIWIYEKGQGTIKNCDLTGNTRGAWDIGSDCRVYRSGNKE